jgi:hypothetical protein
VDVSDTDGILALADDIANLRGGIKAIEVADTIRALIAERWVTSDLIQMAWGLLANVSEGNWERQTDEWQDAVKRWRSAYFQLLDAGLAAHLPTEDGES